MKKIGILVALLMALPVASAMDKSESKGEGS
jgi:hypothetical protein